ncbi:hypothetical protein DY000_02034249 [Brassica cretica]|uniref:F-box associated beta-propeller type 3 domain-containing protein n=1 Tax=Brassica cretica TaxID=69181 RepID=A0ABQ7DQ00_BRACR|nr:hypothetical protein DY000_02034249 [Brassica cretica]
MYLRILKRNSDGVTTEVAIIDHREERRLRDGTTDDLPQRNHVRFNGEETKEEAVGAKGFAEWASIGLKPNWWRFVKFGFSVESLIGQKQHHVLLGQGNATIRKHLITATEIKQRGIQHSCPGYSKCINGVLYYIAKASDCDYMIVCFDVRSEKFSFVKAMKRVLEYHVTLINVNGKLASVRGHVSRRKYKF